MPRNPLDGFKAFFLRFDFLFLVLLLLGINAPFISSSYVPAHDTKEVFEAYYFFYNQFFFQHNIAQWMAFEPFGLAASLSQLVHVDVFMYLTMLVGGVWRIPDALILFKISLFLDWLVLLFGMYLLCRHLFKRRRTTFLICLVLLNQASGWFHQVYFDLRVIDMLPLTIYTFVLFFEKKRARYLALTVLMFCLWWMGSVVYFGALWVFAFLILGAVLWFNNRHGWKDVLTPPIGRHWLLVAGILLAAYGCILYDFNKIMDVSRPGTLSINNYLVHGGASQSLPQFFQSMLNDQDSSRYVGLMPVFFFLWGLFKVREKMYYAFLLTTAALWALSFQGILSLFFYFIPGMVFYHHLAWFWSVIRIFILVCAGFGMENFLASPLKQKIKYLGIIVAAVVFAADAVRLSSDGLFGLATDWGAHDPFISLWLKQTNVLMIAVPVLLLMLLLIGCLWINGKTANRIILGFVFLVVLLDAWSVHATDYRSFKPLDAGYKPYMYTLNVHPPDYQYSRTMEPQPGRQKDAYTLITRPDGIAYSSVFDFSQFDVCYSTFRTDTFSKGFNQLIQGRGNLDKDLLYVVGCGAPKIRLATSGFYFANTLQAQEGIHYMPELFSTLVLSGGDADFAKKKLAQGAQVNADTDADVKKFIDDDLSMDVEVPSALGGWLVYADSYAPGWRAIVDGKKTPIYQAYLAFKAIWLDPGVHRVRFYYQDTVSLICSYIVAIIGTMAGAVLVFIIGRQMIGP